MKPIRGTIFVVCFLIVLTLSSRAHTISQAQESTDNLVYLPIISSAQRPTWIGPDGGSITAVTADPSQPLTMYASTNSGGVFKSLDGGVSWGAVNGGLNTWYITTLAVDPLRPNVLFCAGYKDLLYRSENYGQSWHPVGSGLQAGLVVYSIAFDPVNTNLIYMATRGVSNNGAPPWSGVIYRSQDGGASWSGVLQDVGGSSQQDWAYSIAVDPSKPGTVYAAFHEFGPYKSTDYGSSWAPLNTGINDLSGRSIGIDPFSLDRLFFGVWHTDGAYRSTNGGALWSQVNNGLLGSKVFTMDFDRKLSGKIYLGVFNVNTMDQGIRISTDGGDHWTPGGLSNYGVFSLHADRVEANKVFAGTLEGGLYRSIDGGANWSLSQAGLRGSNATGLVIYKPTGALYAASYGGGVAVTLDKGNTWQEFNSGLGDLRLNDLAVDPANPSILLALTAAQGLYRIDLSSGTTWTSWSTGMPAAAAYTPSFRAPFLETWENFIDPGQDQAAESPKTVLSSAPLLDIAYAPSNAKAAYMGTGGAGVYKTSDGGLHWYSTGLNDSNYGSLAVDPANSGHVYAGMSKDAMVCSSQDGGGSWGCTRLPGTTINTLSWVGKNPGTLFAGTDAGLFRFTSELEWTSAGFEGNSVISAAAYPDNPQNILAGTSTGVYQSLDGGASWSPTLPELRLAVVRSIVIDPQTLLRYFLTAGSGILVTSY